VFGPVASGYETFSFLELALREGSTRETSRFLPKLSDSCRPNVHLRINEVTVLALLVVCWTERPNCLIRTLFSALNAATWIKEAVLVHTPPVAITDRWVGR
jgi:hypothetical protein